MGKHVRTPPALETEPLGPGWPAVFGKPGDLPIRRRRIPGRHAAVTEPPSPAPTGAPGPVNAETRAIPLRSGEEQAAPPKPSGDRPTGRRAQRSTSAPDSASPSLPVRLRRRPPGPYRPPAFPSDRPDLDTLHRVLAALRRL